MATRVLAVNAGSSSLKFALYEFPDTEPVVDTTGQIDGIGVNPHLRVRAGTGDVIADEPLDQAAAGTVAGAGEILLDWLGRQYRGSLPEAVGHRLVLGGPRLGEPVRIDAAVRDELGQVAGLAPLHLPAQVELIDAMADRAPELAQVAVFDTSFHAGRDEACVRLPIPEHLHDEGVRRYGFHGLSYEYVAGRLAVEAPSVAGGKVVIAHLGSGCSLCAIENGRCVDTTMSFSALDGIPMGTRPGRLDPGVVLHLMQGKGMAASDIQRLLYRECGLKALSGLSNDARELEASDDAAARFALRYFALHCARAVGDLAVVLGGLDALVFTAGIGENSSSVRSSIAGHLEWLGVRLDPTANAANAPAISSPDSAIRVLVVPTNEEIVIARHTRRLTA